MESSRAPIAFEEDYLSVESGGDRQSETADLDTDYGTDTPFLPPEVPSSISPSTVDLKEPVPHPLSDTCQANTVSAGDDLIVSIPQTNSTRFENDEASLVDDSDDNEYNSNSIFVQDDPKSCLASYSAEQESVFTDAPSGARPHVQGACVADDTKLIDRPHVQGACVADDTKLIDRQTIQVGDGDDDIDSNTELFAQEQLFTPGRRRKEFLCGMFLKYSIFIFNFLFWVAGVCGFGFGYWMLTSKGQIFTSGAYFFLDPAVMLCIVGCTIFLVAFFGFLGALRENLLLLKIFRVCLVLVLLIQAAIGILMFVFYTMPEARESLLAGPEGVLKEAIKSYHDDNDRREWIDLIQKEFKCCGLSHSNEGYRDWRINMYFNCSQKNPSIQRCAVPVSCCIFEPGDYFNVMCGFHTTDQPREKVFNRIHTKGCLRGLADWMRGNESYIGGFLLGFVTPQVLGLIFSTMYMRHIKRSRARWRLLKRTDSE